MPPANSRAHSPMPAVRSQTPYTPTSEHLEDRVTLHHSPAVQDAYTAYHTQDSTGNNNNNTYYLSALRQIDSIPVPDLASTLQLSSPSYPSSSSATITAANAPFRDDEDDANDANVSFLRTHLDPQEEWRAQNADAWEELQHRQREREQRQRRRERERERGGGNGGGGSDAASSTGAMVAGQGNGGEDRARRERLQRVLNRLNRMHDSSSASSMAGPLGQAAAAATAARQAHAQVSSAATARREGAAYGERIPSENSLYDWSPMGELQREMEAERLRQEHADVEDELRVEMDIERAALLIYSELRRDQPNTHPDVLGATARARAREQIEAERDSARRRAYSSLLSTHGSSTGYPPTSEPLRNQALLQSARRHPRFSQRSREYMQRYVIDRERVQHDNDERDRRQEQRATRSNNDGIWPLAPLRNTESDRHDSSRPTQQEQRANRSSNGPRWQQDARRDIEMEIQDLTRIAQRNHSSFSVDHQSSDRSRTAYRRNYLENPSRLRAEDTTPEPSEWLQKTIMYLAQLRDCTDYEDALSRAVDADFLTKEFMGEAQDDFLLHIDDMPRPQQTSWLAPGAVFAGSQHATNGYSSSNRSRESEQSATSGNSHIPAHIWQNMTSSERRAEERREARRNPSMQRVLDRGSTVVVPDPPEHQRQQPQRTTLAPDRWPVKVTVHAVDWEKMTIAATMEAYNVPHHNSSYSSIISAANATAHANNTTPDIDMPDVSSSSPHPPIHPKSSSITTYLEGEIIDFAQHTLLTESFPSDCRNDAIYWRKLESFSHLTHDNDMTRTLVSKRALAALNKKYILMRWKERCFIPASSSSVLSSPAATHINPAARSEVWDGARPWMNRGDAVTAETGEGCGLTISGFYYVCMRREDGEIEGLYCDPESSPYQHLKLGRVGGGVFPTWSFT